MTTWTKQWWQRGCITVDHVATLASQAMTTRRPMDAMRRMPVVGVMEPMVLFSATPIDPAIMADADAMEPMVATVMEIPLESESSSNGPIQDPTTSDAVIQSDATELIFVDSFVPEIEALLEDIRVNRPDVEAFVLDANRDGVTQITEILETRVGIRSIQVISHAEDSSVRLGNLWLGVDNLDAYAGQLATWDSALTSDADILFFGCELASDADGRTLIDAIAALTGADVAASDNDTGHDRYDADWVLEYATGTIETSVGISESLQDQWHHKLATITVTTLADESNNNSDISLREAINQANAGSGGDTIVFSTSLSNSGIFTLTRQQSEDDNNSRGDLDILKDVTIIGNGVGNTVIDGGSLSRIFDVHAGTLTLSDVTLQHGRVANQLGGAIRVNDTDANLVLSRANLTDNFALHGGGIGNLGTIVLTDVSLVDNGSSNGLTTNAGGAIYNNGTATLSRVTMANNAANRGGAYFQETAASASSLTNVTFSGNTAVNGGGAIGTKSDLSLINSTLTLNTGSNGGGIQIESGTTTLLNTIVSGNVGTDLNPDISGSFDSLGGNLIGDLGTSINTVSPVSTNRPDLIGQPANLGTLANNGGYVQTHALLTGSAAIDAGAVRFSPATDARGLSSLDGRIDIGAYQADAGHLSRIYWIDEDDEKIMSSNLDGSDAQTVIGSLNSPDEIFVDSINGHVYWSETQNNVIRRVNLDGTQAQDVLTGLVGPRGIEIDAKNGHIYWAEDGNFTNRIRRANLDGTNTITLTTIGGGFDLAYKPDDIAIDYERGYLYWTDERSERIERIDLNGDNRTLIATSDDPIRGLAIDPRNDKLYWSTSDGNSRIYQSDLEGNEEVQLISLGLDSPEGIVVDSANGKLFWSDEELPGIFTSNLDGTNVTNLNIPGLDAPQGIALGVSEVNRAPVAVSLNGGPLIENTNTSSGLQVGILEAIDLDPDDTFAFSITGGADAGRFTLAGAANDRLVLTNGVLDFETQPSYEVTVTVEDSAGNALNQTFVLGVRNLPELDGLLFSTRDDVTGSGVTNLPNWDSDQLLQFGNPGLSLHPSGNGTAGAVSTTGFRLQNFIAENDVAIDAMHSVWSGVTVGSGNNAFDLLRGDLLFSIDEDGITFDSATEPDKDFDKNDVIVFRASTPGDYSSGDFFHLLDDPMSTGDIRGIALVESVGGVQVGDTTLAQGTFLLSTSGGSEHDRIYSYEADTVGASSTTGTNQILIEGNDPIEDANGGNLGFSVKIVGIHLVESDVSIGGASLSSGDLLMTVQAGGDGSTTIRSTLGANQDVFQLTMTSTRIGGNASIATVDLLFDGDGVGLLRNEQEEINAITFVEGLTANSPVGAVTDIDASVNSIDEDANVGANVGVRARAVDSDGQTVTYSLISDPDNKFQVDAATGIVTLAAALDYDAATQHSFTVRATSADTSFSQASFTIQVNEFIPANSPPTLSTTAVRTSINESADLTGGVHFANITVNDDGQGVNVVTLGGADAALFELRDGNTSLYLKEDSVLDFDTNPTLSVSIFVNDAAVGGTPDDSAGINFAVGDFNTPPNVTLSQSSSTIAESTATGTRVKVADIVVTDDGTGNNQFSLTGTDAARFEIDGTELFWRGDVALDFETQPTLNVTVAIDDTLIAGGPESTADFTLNVGDVNEAPTITLINGIASVNESDDVSSGRKVADFNVVDDATGTETFSLGGADASLFRIDGTELWLVNDATLDFDVNPVLDVTVSVFDTSISPTALDSDSLSIQVSDTNTAPVVSLSATSVLRPEADASNTPTLMANIVVTDDATGNHQFALSGVDSTSFEIIGTQLFLQAGVSLDFETRDTLQVTVELDDTLINGEPESTANFTLQVTDVNESPTLALNHIVGTVSEMADVSNGIKIADLDVTDDGLGTETLSLTGPDSGLFEIIGGELRLRAGTVLNANTDPTLTVQVELDDPSINGTISEAVQTVNVTVQNTNTAPTLADWQHSTVAGQSVAVSAETFQALADDVDGNALTARIVEPPASGTIQVESSGAFLFTPTPGFVGQITFTWIANDGRVDSAPATVTLTFLPVPAPSTSASIASASVTSAPESDSSGESGDYSDGNESSRTSETDSKPSSDAVESDSINEASSPDSVAGVPINVPNAATSNALQTSLGAKTEQQNTDKSADKTNRDAAASGSNLVSQPTDAIRQLNRGTDNTLGRNDNRMNGSDLSFDFGSDGSTFSSVDYALMTQPGAMWDELDNYQQRVNSQIQGDLIVVGTAGAAASSVTVGVVAWALRSGLLLSGLIAHMPAWKAVDPLLIMQGFSGSADGETLEQLMDRHDKAMANE